MRACPSAPTAAGEEESSVATRRRNPETVRRAPVARKEAPGVPPEAAAPARGRTLPRPAAPKRASGGTRERKWRFRLSAFAVVERRGRVLLARRRDIGLWNLPGGGVEPGETVDEGLLREVREEVRAQVEIVRLVGVYSKPQKNEVVHTFLCRLLPGQEDALGTSDEVSEIGWFAPDALPADLLPKHRQRVLDATSGQLVPFLRAQRTSTEEDQGPLRRT
jgi:ADP-ribose pyrophosphatase YjhB (NUDIX family)